MARPRVAVRRWADVHGIRHQTYVVKRTHNGKTEQKGSFERKRDAEEARYKWEQELERGIYVPKGEKCTFSKVKQKFWERCEWRNTVGDRMSGYRLRALKAQLKRLEKEFGPEPMDQLEPERVQSWLDVVAAETSSRTGGRYKIRTMEQWILTLLMVIDFAVAKNYGLKHNLLKDHKGEILVKPPQRVDVEPERFLEALAVAQLLYWVFTRMRRVDGATNVYRSETLAVLIALFTGMRRGEICALQWQFIDWVRNLIHVRYRATLDEGILPGTKAGLDKTRSIPINPVLRPVLEAHYKLQGQPSIGFVLLNAEGGRVRPGTISSVYWPAVCCGAGLIKENDKNRYRFHDLRHTAGSFWLADNMPLEEVSRLLGHQKVDTTWKIYCHQLEHDRRALVAIQNVSDRFVSLLAANGLELPRAEPLLLEAPVPMLDITPPAATAAINGAALPDDLADWERNVIEMHRTGERIHCIAAHVGRSRERIQKLLIAHGLYARSERRGWSNFDQATIDVVVARWQAGESNAAIAADYDVAENTVNRWARNAGATRTPLRPGPCKGLPRPSYTADIKEQALALWREGKTCAVVGPVVGVKPRTVQRWVHEAGYTRRGQGWKSVAPG